jgi:hypothetical protein
MSSNDANDDRKSKPTTISEIVSSNVGHNPNEESNKARRVSTNASISNAASLNVGTPPVVTGNAAAADNASTAAEDEESIQSTAADTSVLL